MGFINLLKHFGLRYKCPVCGYHAKGFTTIGIDNDTIKKYHIIGAGIRHAGCHKCNSTDRDRLVWTYLLDEQKILRNKNSRILHVAPEKCLAEYFINNNFKNYFCGDFFAEGYENTYPSYVNKLDITQLDFMDNSFDCIICNHVLEHIPNETAALNEIYRVLSNNAFAILQVPISFDIEETIEDPSITSPKLREQTFGQFNHVRLYGKDYTIRLKKAGFIVDTIRNLSKEHPKSGLNENEVLFICRKKITV